MRTPTGSLRRAAALFAGIAGLACPAKVPSFAIVPSAVAQQASPAAATPESEPRQGTGLPLPRFASLKSDRVHLRQGPGTDHRVLWIYKRAGMPVEVLREHEGWRQVRDAEGATGWVAQVLISGRRTALVAPWEVKGESRPLTPVRSDDREGASAVAMVEAGVLANVRSCDGRWCYVSVGDHRGYIEQKRLWGVYDGEVVR